MGRYSPCSDPYSIAQPTRSVRRTSGFVLVALCKRSSKPKDTTKERVLERLRRKEGATIIELAEATDWQNHSIRGFISGTLTKKMGLKGESMVTSISCSE